MYPNFLKRTPRQNRQPQNHFNFMLFFTKNSPRPLIAPSVSSTVRSPESFSKASYYFLVYSSSGKSLHFDFVHLLFHFSFSGFVFKHYPGWNSPTGSLLSFLYFYKNPSSGPSSSTAEDSSKSIYDFTVKVMVFFSSSVLSSSW